MRIGRKRKNKESEDMMQKGKNRERKEWESKEK